MSKRAEEFANKAYPNYSPDGKGQIDMSAYRFACAKGYEQAEKDLALTAEDIKLITKIHYEIVFKDTTGVKVGDVASEVLRRFREMKNK